MRLSEQVQPSMCLLTWMSRSTRLSTSPSRPHLANTRRGRRPRAVLAAWASPGSKRSKRSTLPFTRSMRRASRCCSIASNDLVNPLLTFRFDFLRNKSGQIWHCRIPLAEIGDARYYAYSVSGEAVPQLHSFDPQKVLLDPYAKCVFFPPGFDRKLAMREGPNAGHAPLGVLTASPPGI